MEPRQPGKLEALMAVASAAVMMWYMVPPQDRYWVKLRTLQALHRVSGRLAYREGHRGMADELSGRDYQRYGVAYAFSRVRDRIAKVLDGMRP